MLSPLSPRNRSAVAENAADVLEQRIELSSRPSSVCVVVIVLRRIVAISGNTSAYTSETSPVSRRSSTSAGISGLSRLR